MFLESSVSKWGHAVDMDFHVTKTIPCRAASDYAQSILECGQQLLSPDQRSPQFKNNLQNFSQIHEKPGWQERVFLWIQRFMVILCTKYAYAINDRRAQCGSQVQHTYWYDVRHIFRHIALASGKQARHIVQRLSAFKIRNVTFPKQKPIFVFLNMKLSFESS